MMASAEDIYSAIEPVDVLNQALQAVWAEVCAYFDVSTNMPDMQEIFWQVDLSDPYLAAEAVLCSILLDVTEQVGRFSPWHRKPARAYGLISTLDRQTKKVRRFLAPEAALQWQNVLHCLERLIRQYQGLIRALMMVSDLMDDLPEDEPYISAQCHCCPPIRIQLKKSVLETTSITCQQCQQPFSED
jgi:hypothetical protein